MTLRGKLTILVLGVFVSVGVLSGVHWLAEGEIRTSSTPGAVAAPPPKAPLEVLERLPPSARLVESAEAGVPLRERVLERMQWRAPAGDLQQLEVEYTVDSELTAQVQRVLRRGRVELGHVILLDALDGRVLAYVSTDPIRFPATRPYPTASLMKVLTTAAALRHAPEVVDRPCHYEGNPYRLTRARLDPPTRGRVDPFWRALALSNNQCFAQVAVHDLGTENLLAEIERLGFLEAPAPGHSRGVVDPVEDSLDLGRLGSGLGGSHITPLTAARLAAALAAGELVRPHWIARVTDWNGRDLVVPGPDAPRRVWSPGLVHELRELLVPTTVRGTAKSAFRDRRGRPLLGSIQVAGKTGSLSGRNPNGRYEWFAGVAPAAAPSVAIVAVVVHGDLWWRNASQVAAEVLKVIFCDRGRCDAASVDALGTRSGPAVGGAASSSTPEPSAVLSAGGG